MRLIHLGLLLYTVCVAAEEQPSAECRTYMQQLVESVTDKVREELTASQDEINTTLKRELKASQDEIKIKLGHVESELQSSKKESQITKERFERELQSSNQKVEKLEEENIKLKLDSMWKTKILNTNSNCDIGSHFGYQEYVDTYADGLPQALPGNPKNAYQCLLLCYETTGCVAVNTNPDTKECEGLSEVQLTTSFQGWNFYNMMYPNECYVNALPVLVFQATITSSTDYNDGEFIVWDTIRADTAQALDPNGVYHCPVDGIYSFNLDAVPDSASYSTYVDLYIMTNGAHMKRLYSQHSSSSSGQQAASCTAIFTCLAGDEVWVQAHGSGNGLDGAYWMTSFAGQLLTTDIA